MGDQKLSYHLTTYIISFLTIRSFYGVDKLKQRVWVLYDWDLHILFEKAIPATFESDNDICW